MSLRISTPPPQGYVTPQRTPSKSTPDTTPEKIQKLASQLPQYPWACTLLHSTLSPSLQERCISSWMQEAPFDQTTGGTSDALFLRHEQEKCAVVKWSFQELGTLYARCKDNTRCGARAGIVPGEGAFAEHVAACTMRSYLERAGILPSEIRIPYSAFGKMGHHYLFHQAIIHALVREDHQVCSLGSSAVLHEFIPSCKPFRRSTQDLDLSKIRAYQMLTLCDLVLLNADGDRRNLLQSKEGTLFPIDRSCILPLRAASPVICCTSKLPEVQQPIDETIKAFILNQLNPDILISHLQTMQDCEIEEALGFSKERLDLHAKAIALIQEGVRQELTLSQIASLFEKDPDNFEDTSIFKELVSEKKGSWEDLCKACIRHYKTTFPAID